MKQILISTDGRRVFIADGKNIMQYGQRSADMNCTKDYYAKMIKEYERREQKSFVTIE